MTIKLCDIFIGNFRVSQRFGGNAALYQQFGQKGHNGVDWALPKGTQLINPFPEGHDVVVQKVGWDASGYGNFVYIWDKTQNAVAIFAHMSEVSVKVGQKLRFQELVGLSGNTGYSTGAHLHFAIGKTNSSGTRLNQNNGYSGWLDALGANVSWDIKNPSTPKEHSGAANEVAEDGKTYNVTVTAGKGLRVRTEPNTSSAIVKDTNGSGKNGLLAKGDHISHCTLVKGEVINGYNGWYKSTKGRYFSSAYTDNPMSV